MQVCLAYKGEGGRTIAVLSSRAKPDMEAVLKDALPIADRHGSTIVVRQGAGPPLLRVLQAYVIAVRARVCSPSPVMGDDA